MNNVPEMFFGLFRALSNASEAKERLRSQFWRRLVCKPSNDKGKKTDIGISSDNLQLLKRLGIFRKICIQVPDPLSTAEDHGRC